MTTGLEPVISCVTGRRINHLSYATIFAPFLTCPKTEVPSLTVRRLQRALCLLSVTIRLSWASTRRFHQISLAGWIKFGSTLSFLNRLFIFQGSFLINLSAWFRLFSGNGRARTYNPSVNSRVLYHWATDPYFEIKNRLKFYFQTIAFVLLYVRSYVRCSTSLHRNRPFPAICPSIPVVGSESACKP